VYMDLGNLKCYRHCCWHQSGMFVRNTLQTGVKPTQRLAGDYVRICIYYALRMCLCIWDFWPVPYEALQLAHDMWYNCIGLNQNVQFISRLNLCNIICKCVQTANTLTLYFHFVCNTHDYMSMLYNLCMTTSCGGSVY
jgi:hypothetical protein